MEKRQYLIVTDDLDLCQTIQARFYNDQLVELHCATTVPQAFSYMIKETYCLIIIDLQFTKMDRGEVIQVVRATKPFPILALTEKMSETEKLQFYHLGVNVFLEKPINADICAAQASALVELFFKNSTEEVSDSDPYAPVSFGTVLIISPRFHRVTASGHEIRLTKREFDLLIFFARHTSQVFTLGQLYKNVWGDYSDLSGEATVRTHIKKLRKKLSLAGLDPITNVWGAGYKFVLPAKKDCKNR